MYSKHDTKMVWSVEVKWHLSFSQMLRRTFLTMLWIDQAHHIRVEWNRKDQNLYMKSVSSKFLKGHETLQKSIPNPVVNVSRVYQKDRYNPHATEHKNPLLNPSTSSPADWRVSALRVQINLLDSSKRRPESNSLWKPKFPFFHFYPRRGFLLLLDLEPTNPRAEHNRQVISRFKPKRHYQSFRRLQVLYLALWDTSKIVPPGNSTWSNSKRSEKPKEKSLVSTIWSVWNIFKLWRHQRSMFNRYKVYSVHHAT